MEKILTRIWNVLKIAWDAHINAKKQQKWKNTYLLRVVKNGPKKILPPPKYKKEKLLKIARATQKSVSGRGKVSRQTDEHYRRLFESKARLKRRTVWWWRKVDTDVEISRLRKWKTWWVKRKREARYSCQERLTGIVQKNTSNFSSPLWQGSPPLVVKSTVQVNSKSWGTFPGSAGNCCGSDRTGLPVCMGHFSAKA